MKTFLILLLMGNVAGWIWVVSQDDSMAVVNRRNTDSESFQSASIRLELLDASKAEAGLFSENLASAVDVPVDVVDIPPLLASRQEESPEKLEQNEPWCGESSEIESEQIAVAWVQDWKSQGEIAAIDVTEVPISSTWWVHLPPFADEVQTKSVLLELKEKQIDSFLMRTGELAGGISLGVFSQRASALIVKSEMEAKGYYPEVKEVLRMAKRFKISANLSDKKNLDMAQFQMLLANPETVLIHETPCR